jgi:hypothetical protein
MKIYLSNPMLVDLVIQDNIATACCGGGIYIWYSNSIISNVIIRNNSGIQGGGVYFGWFGGHVSNVEITGNTATSSGAIELIRSSFSMENIIISSNSSDSFGFIKFHESSLILRNSIIWNNSVDYMYFTDFEDSEASAITITYSNIQGGVAAIVTNDNGTVSWGDGNINDDPLFCDPDNGDFTLGENSPCVGTGQDGEIMGALGVGCEPTGCTDSEACNYNETANIDNGSCEYEIDCSGECDGDAELDCFGECDGDAYIDGCGVCDSDPYNDCCTADVCLSIENVDTGAGTLDIYMENSVEVAGFQFELFGITLSGASGGIAGAVMDMVNTNAGTGIVLGMSFSGNRIPPGEGVLTQISFSEYAGSDICFGTSTGNNVIPDTDGNALWTTWGDCYDSAAISGCMDGSACNYDADATEDDGSCDYAMETCWDGTVVCDESNCPAVPNGSTPVLFENNQSSLQSAYFFTNVTIDGEPVDANDWVGAFCDDICVGSKQWDTSQCGGGVCSINVNGNDGYETTAGYCDIGDAVTFKIYDESADIYYDAVASEDFTWSISGFNNIDNLQSTSIYVDPHACDSDVCLFIENVDTNAGTLDIYMENSVYVAGFQFELFGITLSGASGGTASDYLDYVSANAGTGIVLGMSFSGSTIPPGEGVLKQISLSSYAEKLICVNTPSPGGIVLPEKDMPKTIPVPAFALT